jgi:squalene-hopene/tetraprenyl-beta-curcumene cyclase
MTAITLSLQETIAAGLDYILSMQAEDGSWTEWALPPGSSSIWTTAYVGYKLRYLPLKLAAIAAPRIAAAARWLSDKEFADCGWGYNEAVGSDADSTSYAILFLASAGLQVPNAAYTLLGNLQCADGGFATYLPICEPDSWNVSHPDVTPIALLALLTLPAPDRKVIQRGIGYVLQHKTLVGLWNSFWWRSCLYGTEASLSLLDAAGIEMPSSAALIQIEPENSFEVALLTSSLLYVERDASHGMIRDLVDTLICQQRPDGSWNTAPILRITRRDCYEPWVSGDAGQLYVEPNRLFTTTTVLHALIKAHLLFKGED